MGVKAVLVKSFARIHETNLKKQGILGFINGFGIKAFPISLIVYEVSAIIMIITFLISNGRS